MTLSELIARAEHSERRLARAAEQPTWTDPDSGYRRRALSPAAGGPLELVEVSLPAGAEVAYPADTYVFIHQQLWVIEGTLRFLEGDRAARARARRLPAARRPRRLRLQQPGRASMPLPRRADAALNVEGPAGESGAFDQAGCRGVSAVTKSARRGGRT